MYIELDNYTIVKSEYLKYYLNDIIKNYIELENLSYYENENDRMIAEVKEYGNSDYVLLSESIVDNYCKINMIIYDKETARDFAIKLQFIISENNFSYGELASIYEILQELASKYNLKKEFKENGML